MRWLEVILQTILLFHILIVFHFLGWWNRWGRSIHKVVNWLLAFTYPTSFWFLVAVKETTRRYFETALIFHIRNFFIFFRMAKQVGKINRQGSQLVAGVLIHNFLLIFCCGEWDYSKAFYKLLYVLLVRCWMKRQLLWRLKQKELENVSGKYQVKILQLLEGNISFFDQK